MCSIMGYCGRNADRGLFMEGFQRTISRGPDATRIIDTGNGLLGFHRLSIMGLTASGMQPFEMNGSYVVCNGEIYGFSKLRAELEEEIMFHTTSDTEVVLKAYLKYGDGFIDKIDMSINYAVKSFFIALILKFPGNIVKKKTKGFNTNIINAFDFFDEQIKILFRGIFICKPRSDAPGKAELIFCCKIIKIF